MHPFINENYCLHGWIFIALQYGRHITRYSLPSSKGNILPDIHCPPVRGNFSCIVTFISSHSTFRFSGKHKNIAYMHRGTSKTHLRNHHFSLADMYWSRTLILLNRDYGWILKVSCRRYSFCWVSS